jgi:excisionase family DNA binding protein
MDELMTTVKAAQEWGCSRRTIERFIKSGKLKAKRAGRYYKIFRSDWETFKARQLVDVA